jgi:hypothetical protein
MNDPAASTPPPPGPDPRRLFLYDKEWRIAVKLDSHREFCYMMAPGEDHYHRLREGEIYLAREDEKLCLACGERRGLLCFSPRTLAQPVRIAVPTNLEPLEPGRSEPI